MKKVVLTIMDGLGYRKEAHGNAVVQAHPEHLIHLFKKYPHSLLEASGSAVGLPNGQMGNSEVGHMNIGAGRIVYQPLEQINQSIDNQTFFENETLLETIRHCKENHSALHLMGLISDGGVHSHLNHLLALLDLCKRENVEKLYLHLFTDGRDVAPKSAYTYIEKVEEKLIELPDTLKVAVMGCVVNGPGEAKEADIGLAGGKGKGVIFKKGEIIHSVQGEENLLKTFLAELDKLKNI